MRINNDHLYHGAALTQVAEHPTFKAINAVSFGGVRSRSAFLINHDIGLYLKYATEPKKPFDEYIFTFRTEHLKELQALKQGSKRVFVGFICVEARHICCIPEELLFKLIHERRRERGADEDIFTVLVTIPSGKSFRVYMNAPGRRKVSLGKRIIPRDDFPQAIFTDPRIVP